MHVVQEPMNWNGLGHERVSADALDIIEDGLFLVTDGKPFDIFSGAGTRTLAHIAEANG